MGGPTLNNLGGVKINHPGYEYIYAHKLLNDGSGFKLVSYWDTEWAVLTFSWDLELKSKVISYIYALGHSGPRAISFFDDGTDDWFVGIANTSYIYLYLFINLF